MDTISTQSQERFQRSENLAVYMEHIFRQVVLRCSNLWYRLDTDPTECIVVGALWWSAMNRILWAVNPVYSKMHHLAVFYGDLDWLFGRDIVTFTMIVLAVMGMMSCLLMFNKLRRAVVLTIGTYFVVSGVLMWIFQHTSLVAGYHIFIFGFPSAWVYWRLGRVEMYDAKSR
jgi:hypothetical protein